MLIATSPPTMNAYVATAIISTVPNLVLFLIPDRLLQSANGMNYMLCFAAGALLGDVFLHTLPHLLTEDSHGAGGHDHDKGIFVGLAVLTGFALFMLSERVIGLFVSHHTHGEPHKDHDDKVVKDSGIGRMTAQGWLNLAADALHNFTDGVAIGVSYRAGSSLGLATLLSVFFHELPHEFADFTILVTSGLTKFQAIRMQFVTALAALLGTWAGSTLSSTSDLMQDGLIAATAGGFVYIATIGALAGVMQSRRKVTLTQALLEMLLIGLGVAMMVVVAMNEGEEEHGHSHSNTAMAAVEEHLMHSSSLAAEHVHTHGHDHDHDHHHH